MNKNPLSALISLICNSFTAVFGKLHWNSPNWLSHLRNKAQKTPKTFWGSSLFLLLLVAAGSYGAYWYKQQPKPLYISAQITAPEITPINETLTPNPVTLNF